MWVMKNWQLSVSRPALANPTDPAVNKLRPISVRKVQGMPP